MKATLTSLKAIGKWLKSDVPVIGRAVTAMFMPSRPDVEKILKSVADINRAGREIQMHGQ